MASGQYRHRVDLTGPAGAPAPAVWYCALQSVGASVVDGQAAFIVRGRYHPGINLETQILHDGRVLQVQAVSDVDERHIETVLSAVEVRGRK